MKELDLSQQEVQKLSRDKENKEEVIKVLLASNETPRNDRDSLLGENNNLKVKVEELKQEGSEKDYEIGSLKVKLIAKETEVSSSKEEVRAL